LLAAARLIAAEPNSGRAPQPVRQAATKPGMVRLNFPPEVELRTLADYVGGRLGIKILYDEEIANKKVSLRVPGEVPVESLLSVLQSALKMKGLMLVEADTPGWKRIVSGAKLPSFAPLGDAQSTIAAQSTGTPVTQPFLLKHADTQKVDSVIKPFLTQPGANSIVLKDPNVLIVTDYASNLLKVAKLIELMDQPRSSVTVQFVPVQNMDAQSLAQQINSILTAKAKARGDTGNDGLEVSADARTNQLVIVGAETSMAEAISLARVIDVPLGLQTTSYCLHHVSPERIDRLAKQLIDSVDAKRLYQSATDAENGILVVTTTPAIHARIRTLTTSMDSPTAARFQQSPIRIYRLKNTTVDQVMETLRAIGEANTSAAGENAEGKQSQPPVDHSQPEGPVHLPLPPQSAPGSNGSQGSSHGGVARRSSGGRLDGNFPGGAKISADMATNSLIVLADPPTQRMYADLIARLDKRQPQVLIEAKVITLDTSHNFSLGVELSKNSGVGLGQLLTFSSFGLSTVSATTGALALNPGTGFNGALLDPGVADIVLQALSSNSRAKVVASPRILVNDNGKGQLQSVLSVSYSSVNASSTVATTSVGGSQDAGTTIDVTPHISEGDYLQLDFSIEFSSFESGGTASVPAPRNIDKVQSTVTIPDGHTVIVGGLNRISTNKSNSGVPVLQHIPVVGALFGNRSEDTEKSALFIFIRPTILRDDKFKDLKFLSERDAQCAKAPSQYPTSEPLLMH
jgi:type II secretory pathway component GspD/PulD (secretin)